MSTYCGAKCEECTMTDGCKGCLATKGAPFGKSCLASEYIKVGGKDKYDEFKSMLLGEVNNLLAENGIGKAENLYELPGAYVNLAYPLPNGNDVRFLDDKKIYLGCQIEFGDMGVCYGVVADSSFILICSYSQNGSEPELIAYKKR